MGVMVKNVDNLIPFVQRVHKTLQFNSHFLLQLT